MGTCKNKGIDRILGITKITGSSHDSGELVFVVPPMTNNEFDKLCFLFLQESVGVYIYKYMYK